MNKGPSRYGCATKGFTGPSIRSTFVLMKWKRWAWREAWLEGAYALRQRLSREHQVHAALRVSQAAQGSFRSKTHRLFFVVMLTGEESMWLPRAEAL
jgi:hypothetical protein